MSRFKLGALRRCDVCDVTLHLTPLPYVTRRHNNVNPLALRAWRHLWTTPYALFNLPESLFQSTVRGGQTISFGNQSNPCVLSHDKRTIPHNCTLIYHTPIASQNLLGFKIYRKLYHVYTMKQIWNKHEAKTRSTPKANIKQTSTKH